jgi:L-alanine-DL-glutamate epimerase-like enolase superfamily enzyme
MAASTTIRTLTASLLDIPLIAPFGIATGTQDVARNLLVQVELADGTRGYGEAAPFPAVNGETQELARAAVEAAKVVVEGADVREWRRLAAGVRQAIGRVGSAQCAIETAILDALTRQARVPLWAFFGGVETRLDTDMTITTGTVDEARSATRDILARGISVIKVKLGAGDIAEDVARVAAIRAVAPGSPLLLDGNCGFDADGALQVLVALKAQGISVLLFEQPVPRDDIDGLRQVSQWGGVPVAADESAGSAADVLRLIQERACHAVNIKLMKCGIVEALDIAALCRAAHLRLMIGGMVESKLAMTTSACFAAGLGGFEYVDLDTPMLLAEDPFSGGWEQRGSTLDLAGIAAGHGVTPKI